MLPHYQICRRKKMQTKNVKKCHMNQLSFHSYRKIKPRANFEFPIFIVSSINNRCSSSKNHKDNSSVCCTFGTEWTRASLTMKLMSGVGVFAHVCEQTLDNLSSCCDTNNIHSAIWMKLYFFCKYMRVLILFGNFMTNLNFWITKGSAATYLRCGGK